MTAMPAQKTMSIGEVLAELRIDFPDITISKIRFLESEGLVEPQRTPAGYRRFTHDNLARLRYVLFAQRDHYLPLRVIKQHLEALDQGTDQPLANVAPVLHRAASPDGAHDTWPTDRSGPRFTRAEVVESAGVDDGFFDELSGFGLVATRPGSSYFDRDAVLIAKIAAELATYGVEPRHLRAVRTAADREIGLVEQIVAPLRHQRGPGAQGRADEVAREIASLSARLHELLVKGGLRRH